jgi:hypothetical protein
MSAVNFTERLTITEVADLIVACPDVRFLVRGEPGIGKSSLGKLIQQKTGLPMSYLDCAGLELGELSIPGVDKELGVSTDYPKKRLNLHLGGPFILVLDEILKAPTAVQNMLNPTLESSNPRLGDYPIPAGSYIVLTSNLASDGVGDTIKAHTRMRIVEVEMAKPTADVWVPWAIENNVNPKLVAWVHRTPEVLASYRDAGNEENYFIYHPKRPNAAYVTGRTLERAGLLMDAEDKMTPRALHMALRGCIGPAATESLLAFSKFADQIPQFERIVADPLGTPVPTSPGACVLVAFGAIQKMTAEAMPKFMQYMERMAVEWQTVFCVNLAKSSKQSMAFKCRAFAEWVSKNQDLL